MCRYGWQIVHGHANGTGLRPAEVPPAPNVVGNLRPIGRGHAKADSDFPANVDDASFGEHRAIADRIRLVSADGYSASVSLEEALSEKSFLAYELEGKPIPVLHGFPVRAIFPELSGNRWVKWLVKIEVE